MNTIYSKNHRNCPSLSLAQVWVMGNLIQMRGYKNELAYFFSTHDCLYRSATKRIALEELQAFNLVSPVSLIPYITKAQLFELCRNNAVIGNNREWKINQMLTYIFGKEKE